MPAVLWTLKQELLFYSIFSLVFFAPIFGFSVLGAWGLASSVVSGSSPILEWLFNVHNIQFMFGIAAAFIFVRGALHQSIG